MAESANGRTGVALRDFCFLKNNRRLWNEVVRPFDTLKESLAKLIYFFGAIVAELYRTSLSQSIDPLSLQKVPENSLVNLFIICEYD
jgi:hypothetical protein